MNPTYQRATILFDQGRHADAEREFRASLGTDPHDPFAHAMLALCLLTRKEPDGRVLDDAEAEAEQAIGLAPDLPFCHYVRANVLYRRNRYAGAEAAIGEALRLDGNNPSYFWLLGAIRLETERPAEALRAAEQGLAIDPDHAGCVNLRAMSLVKLGRKAEAGAAIDVALSRDPHNAVTHANRGWTLLHQGDHVKALEHFREALRIDPELDWARAGIVEALKARHLIYRVMLAYFLWMNRLGRRAQWAIVLGLLFGSQALNRAAESNPAIQPYVLPIQIAYIGFVILTWLADPFFNLLLRLNKYGRYALSHKQRIQSNVIGGLLLAGAIALAAGIWTGTFGLVVFGLVLGLLMLPVTGAFGVPAGWPRGVMIAACAVVAIAGFTWAGVTVIDPLENDPAAESFRGIAESARHVFTLGILGSTLGSNWLRGVRVEK